MLLKELREQVAEYGKKMFQEGLTSGTGGYISARDPETGLICSTPSSREYMTIFAEDILVSDGDGNIIEGDGKISSEWKVQQDLYKRRSDINAIVHVHSRFSTTLACLQMDLPAAFFWVPLCGAESVRCTKYADFYSQELSDDIYDKMQGRMACLMGNHGMLAAGENLKDAYALAVAVEYSAEIYWRAKCIGEPYILTAEEVEQQKASIFKYKHINDK